MSIDLHAKDWQHVINALTFVARMSERGNDQEKCVAVLCGRLADSIKQQISAQVRQ